MMVLLEKVEVKVPHNIIIIIIIIIIKYLYSAYTCFKIVCCPQKCEKECR